MQYQQPAQTLTKISEAIRAAEFKGERDQMRSSYQQMQQTHSSANPQQSNGLGVSFLNKTNLARLNQNEMAGDRSTMQDEEISNSVLKQRRVDKQVRKAQHARAVIADGPFREPASKQTMAFKRESNSSSQHIQQTSVERKTSSDEQHRMQAKFNVYNIRYRLQAEEIRSTVQDILKPQVLRTIRLGQ